MLVRIWSPKFKSNGEPRPPIEFHPGLNTIEGGKRAENAIGKSTVLQLIDFAYGGDDFAKSDTVQYPGAIGHHTIYFTLRLHHTDHHFSRDTAKPREVTEYSDSAWKEVSRKYSLDEYRDFLLEHYGLAGRDGSFRELVGRYIRIGEDDIANLDKPLSAYSRAKDVDGIKALLKLLNDQNIIELQEKVERLDAQYTSVSKVAKLGVIDALRLTKKSEYEEAKTRLKNLQNRSKNLRTQADLDLFHAKTQARYEQQEVRRHLVPLRERLADLEAKLQIIKATISGEHRFTSQKLQEFYTFFPQAAREKLETIEYYHNRLTEIFRDQLEDQEQECQTAIAETKHQIDKGLLHIQKLGQTVELDDAIYDENAELAKEITGLTMQISNYEENEKRKADRKLAKDELQQELVSLDATIKKINDLLAKYKSELYSGPKNPKPAVLSLQVKKSLSYSFDHQGNNSIGNKSINLLLLDYVLLTITDLPLLIHDSTLIKQAAYEPVEALMQVYAKSKDLTSKAEEPKQIFFAFDATESYSKQAARVVEETRVIRLNDNKGALYGLTWGDIPEPHKEEETS